MHRAPSRPPSCRPKSWAPSLVALVLVVLALSGCTDSWRPPEKAPGSALWLGLNSAPLEASELARLAQLGVNDFFMTVARLEAFNPEGPLVPVDAPKPPSSVSLTLVVSGEWTEGDPEELASRVAEDFRQLRFDMESQGGLPVGLHFDVLEISSFETYARFLQALRKELDRDYFLSVSLDRKWTNHPELSQVTSAVDFVVPFLYGQRIKEAEDGRAWDFVELESLLQRYEELGTPYMIGVVSLGTATHLSTGGGVKARMTTLSLQEILWDRALKLRPGFSLEGVNRRVYAVAAEKSTKVGKWSIKAGEGVRVVRAATSDIEELTRLVAAWGNPKHLGQLYYRLPSSEERLSLTLENLLNALDPTPASPDLDLDISLQRRTGRGWLVRMAVRNRNGEITELSLLDSNYIQAIALNGEFSARVRPGDFYRFELYRTKEGSEPVRNIRRPNLLRFHLPILEGGQELWSGDVEVKVRGTPTLQVEGRFLLPDGRSIEVGPRIWSGGKFQDDEEEEDAEAETEAAAGA